MAGYGARKTGSVGVRDELNAVVVYLAQGETEAALITLDLIGVDAMLVMRVRTAVSAAADLPADGISLACSHTHGGPEMRLDRGDPRDEQRQAYVGHLVHLLAGAVAEAKQRAVSVRAAAGRQDCSFGKNRRLTAPDGSTINAENPAGPRAPFTDVLRLDDSSSGAPLAVLFSYACHATTLVGNNYLFSADYPGEAKRTVERLLPGVTAAFAAGCCGDINPYPRGTPDLVFRHGATLGCAAAQAALEAERLEDLRLRVVRKPFHLPIDPAPSREEAQARLAALEREAEAERRDARTAAGGRDVPDSVALNWLTARRLRAARELLAALEGAGVGPGLPVEAHVLAVGEFALAAMPGEIFVDIGASIAAGSPFARTVAVSHANGAIGYLPSHAEIPRGGYEVTQARALHRGLQVADHADQAMIDGVLAALREARA
jgi:hypothetical protein